jgi:hypothetical protein
MPSCLQLDASAHALHDCDDVNPRPHIEEPRPSMESFPRGIATKFCWSRDRPGCGQQLNSPLVEMSAENRPVPQRTSFSSFSTHSGQLKLNVADITRFAPQFFEGSACRCRRAACSLQHTVIMPTIAGLPFRLDTALLSAGKCVGPDAEA